MIGPPGERLGGSGSCFGCSLKHLILGCLISQDLAPSLLSQNVYGAQSWVLAAPSWRCPSDGSSWEASWLAARAPNLCGLAVST